MAMIKTTRPYRDDAHGTLLWKDNTSFAPPQITESCEALLFTVHCARSLQCTTVRYPGVHP